MSSTKPTPETDGCCSTCCSTTPVCQFLQLNRKKVLRTLLLTYALLCYGLQTDILGPALPTFVQQTETDFQLMSTVFSCKALGLAIGALTGGFVGNHFNKHRYLIVCLMLALSSFVFLIFPFASNAGLMIFLMVILGYFHSNIIMNCNVLLGGLWDGNSGPGYNFMHTGSSLGGIFATLIVRPFLVVEKEAPKANSRPVKIIGPILNDLPPFSILACLSLIGSIMFLVVWFFQNIKRASKELQANPKTEVQNVICPLKIEPQNSLLNELKRVHRSRKFEKGIIAVIPFAMLFIISGEKIFANFSVSYFGSNKVDLTENEVLLMNMLFWLFFTIGRILFAFITTLVSVKLIFLLSSQVTFFILLGFSFIVGGKANNFAVVIFYGLFSGALVPCLFGSVNSVMHITGLVAMLLELGKAVAVLVMNNVAGVAMSDYGVQSFVYTLAALHGLNVLVSIVIIVLIEMVRKTKDDMEVQLISDQDTKNALSYDSISEKTEIDLAVPKDSK